MKYIHITFCTFILTTLLFAGGLNSKPWSETVNGIQAKITIKQTKVVNETSIISTYLTLRNVSDIGNPMKVEWDNVKIIFRVIDERGKEVAKVINMSYDGPIFTIGVFVLPHDSNLTFNISRIGLGIPKGKAALLDFGPMNSWVIDKTDSKKYFLQVTLTIKNFRKPRNYWHGTINIPKAEIPLRNK